MITHTIEVRNSGLLKTSGNGYLGKQGDKGVNSLKFVFPTMLGDRGISEYENKRLWCKTEHKIFTRNLDNNNSVIIDGDFTTGTWVEISVQLMIGEAVLWGTKTHRFFFTPFDLSDIILSFRFIFAYSFISRRRSRRLYRQTRLFSGQTPRSHLLSQSS